MKEKINSYMIITGTKSEEVAKDVNRFINTGFQPWGVLCVALVEGSVCFYQAMIQYEK